MNNAYTMYQIHIFIPKQKKSHAMHTKFNVFTMYEECMKNVLRGCTVNVFLMYAECMKNV